MFSDLGIVIVNLDLKEITRACIHSLLISGADLRQIILVDNGSQDNSVEFLREQFGPDMSIVQVEKNLGYAHGLNLGIPMALQNGAKWLLLMNNDVEVAEDFFSELEKATHSPFAIISPLILYYDLPNQIWYGGDLLKATTANLELTYPGVSTITTSTMTASTTANYYIISPGYSGSVTY